MKPDFTFEVYLQPGEFYWGDDTTRIKTLLGSCVAICMWHPKKLIGGMSHSLLPKSLSDSAHSLNARYVCGAVDLFLSEINKSNTRPSEYEVKIFGGGEMFLLEQQKDERLGQKNVLAAELELQRSGFNIVARSTGGTGHRNLIFDLWSGEVWVKHVEKPLSKDK